MWVLECEETNVQGTGFFLQGFGLITCAHVLGTKTQAFHASNPYQRYPVTVIASDSHVDLAILAIDAEVQANLKLGNPDAIRQHSRILLAGHPAYGIGDALYKRAVEAEMTRTPTVNRWERECSNEMARPPGVVGPSSRRRRKSRREARHNRVEACLRPTKRPPK